MLSSSSARTTLRFLSRTVVALRRMVRCLLPLPHPVVAKVPVVARAADPRRRRTGRATPVGRARAIAATHDPSIAARVARAGAGRPVDLGDRTVATAVFAARAVIGATRTVVPGAVTAPRAVPTADRATTRAGAGRLVDRAEADLSDVTAVIAARAVIAATRAAVPGAVTAPRVVPTADRATSRADGPGPARDERRAHRGGAISLARVHRVGSVATARAITDHRARRARAGRVRQAVRGPEPVDRHLAGATTFVEARDVTQRRAGRHGATTNASKEGPVEVARAVPSVRRAPSIPR